MGGLEQVSQRAEGAVVPHRDEEGIDLDAEDGREVLRGERDAPGRHVHRPARREHAEHMGVPRPAPHVLHAGGPRPALPGHHGYPLPVEVRRRGIGQRPREEVRGTAGGCPGYDFDGAAGEGCVLTAR